MALTLLGVKRFRGSISAVVVGVGQLTSAAGVIAVVRVR
jgi:hypothetical protein